MSAGAPWSVKGIDPKAREVAKDLARRSGMTLGEWLNRVILEDDLPEDVTAEAQVSDRLHRLSNPAPRLAVAPGSSDLARVGSALDRVTERIEASETRTGLAIHGVEHSVRQALARIETAEREQRASVHRLESLVAENTADQVAFGARLRHLESEPAGPRSVEAMQAIELRLASVEPEAVTDAVLQRLGERLAEAEARTANALETLQKTLASFDRRVAAVERHDAVAAEQRFEALGLALTQQVEQVRGEVARKLEAATGPALEARLSAMAETVKAAERRSTRAVEEIGRQVLLMAEAVSRKLGEVDQRSADAIDQVGSEVARIAGAVELRLARGEHTQAEAFERLNAGFSRVTDALAARGIGANAEVYPGSAKRDAVDRHPVDEIEPMLAAIDQQVDQTLIADDAAVEPDPQTAALLEEARQRLGLALEVEVESDPPAKSDLFMAPDPQTLALLQEARQRLGPPPEPEPEPIPIEAAAPPTQTGPFDPELFARAEPGDEGRQEPYEAPWRRLDLNESKQDVETVFVPIREPDDEALFAPRDAPAPSPELSTREVIDRARAAARAANANPPLDMRAKVDRKAATGRLFQGFGAKPPARRQNTTLQTALLVAGGAAFLSVGAAGLTLMQGPAGGARDAEVSSFGHNPRAAVALSAPAQPVSAPVYEQVRRDVETGAPGAVARLKALADADYPQAQLYLAQLYDLGQAGLARDPVEARRLVALAAANGDIQAMHNLGVFFFRGEGGPQDLSSAAQWFRKAAEGGVVESQYNLALLYQSGSGLQKDLTKARYWFAEAAGQGDTEAGRALASLDRPSKPRPAGTPAGQARPYTPATGPGVSQNVRQTQLILARLGYYDGPADGLSNPAYRTALSAYQTSLDGQGVGARPTLAQ
jgi:localization factor PodJL